MENYERCVRDVMEFLTENSYCEQLIQANNRCFNRLGTALNKMETDYSPETAENWFRSSQDMISKNDLPFYRMALNRLKDIFEYGCVQKCHDTRHLMSTSVLCDSLRHELDGYLDSLRPSLSEITIINHKRNCARFLVFIQRNGVQSISGISYTLICDFYDQDKHCGYFGKTQVNAAVSDMMRYFYEQKMVSYGFTTIIHYLSHGRNTGCYWNLITDKTRDEIICIISKTDTVDIETLRSYKDIFEKAYRDNCYSKTMVCSYRTAIELLILFLDMNSFRYNPEIAMLWYEDIRPYFGNQYDIYRRSLCLIADYHRSSTIKLEQVYKEKPSAFYLMPEWCRVPACQYVDEKTKEGWAKSTLDMIRSSITRFCTYLDGEGIRSFRDVTSETIKQFNLHDLHKTPQGKNAYNIRIRKFLIYLGTHGYLKNPMLFVALTKTYAPKESIVVVLTEDEMQELSKELKDSDTTLTLRKKAMLLLGLKMGLRASDIVNLEIDNVDWDEASIRFVQKKTAVEVNLPMPPEVGNALFRYITEERYPKENRKIFLTENAPHKPVGRQVCNDALEDALPDRNVEGSGFHVTRKTYATNLLRNGVGESMVAEALGQQGLSSVHRYLSLDSDRMKMCPLSLSECSVGGWTYGR